MSIDDLRMSAIFGPTVPSSWFNSTVTFARYEGEDDGFGGFRTVGQAVDYLTAGARVDVAEPPGDTTTLPGPSTRRGLLIFIHTPDDPAKYPKKGDRVKWTDIIGNAFDLPVKAVVWPDNLKAHVEIETEEIT